MGKRVNTAVWTGTRWHIKVQKDGERRSFYSSIPGREGQREANRRADQWLDEGIDNQRRRVDQVYPLFLQSKQESTSISNYRPMDGRWRNHIRPIIGSMPVARLTENDLQNVINKAYANDNLSKKTLMNIRNDLTAFIKYCRRAKLTALMPESLSIPSAARKSEKTVLQPRDFAVLFSSSETIYNGRPAPDPLIHAYRLSVLTGLRPGELRGLQWGDVNNGRLELRRAVNYYSQITQGKNDNARRVIELSNLARIELEAQRHESAMCGPTDFVFYIPSTEYYDDYLRRYCEHNGIPHCTPYELRHTFISIAKCLPSGLVKSIVGHSENMDTFGVYGHELDIDAATRTAALNETFEKLLRVGQVDAEASLKSLK